MKLSEIENNIQHGDIILIRKNRFISKAICTWTNSFFSHVGVIVKHGDKWFIVDSNEKGVDIDPLVRRLETTEAVSILRPKASKVKINKAVKKLEKFTDTKTPYDFLLFLRIAIETAIKVKLNFNTKGFTCSEFSALYLSLLSFNHGLKENCIPQEFAKVSQLKKII